MKIKIKDPLELRKSLLTKGYSLRSFSESISISSGYFSQLLNEDRCPSGKIARRIADELNADFDDIFFIENACCSNHNELEAK